MKRYDLPYLGSGSVRIDLLQSTTGILLLQVQSALALFNQHVDDASRYHWMTFEELADENHVAAQENLEKTYRHLLDAALNLASLVARALARPDFADLGGDQPVAETQLDTSITPDMPETGVTKGQVERRKESEEASRILLRPSERIMNAFRGVVAKIENRSVFEQLGASVLKTDIENLIAGISDLKSSESQAQLIRLHGVTLEREIRDAIVSAERKATELDKLASPYYTHDDQRPWEVTAAWVFDRHAEAIRTHFHFVWNKIIAALKGLHEKG
jgi:hypothetical protein